MPDAHHVRLQGHDLQLTNLAKVMYPATGFSKAQMLEYYVRVAPVMVPHLKGRPLNLKRYPDGVEAPFFFQKECPVNRPAWMRTASIWSDTRGAPINYCNADDAASLVWLANMGNLEIHALLYKGTQVDRPSFMVFDLDPGHGAGLMECGEVASFLRDALRGMSLKAVQKVSGGKGMQLYVPLNTKVSFDATRSLSRALAQDLERQHPGLVVSNMRKELRRGKVLVDWSQNNPHKSTVCVYSLRAQKEPFVSTPVTWREVEDAVASQDPDLLRFRPADVLDRVKSRGDLFKEALTLKQRLPAQGA